MIGKTLQELRKSRGLNQGELAASVGFSQRVMSALEREESNPTIAQLKALSKFFDVSIDYLVTGINVEVTPTEREILTLIKEDSGLMNSLVSALTAKKNVMNRLAA